MTSPFLYDWGDYLLVSFPANPNFSIIKFLTPSSLSIKAYNHLILNQTVTIKSNNHYKKAHNAFEPPCEVHRIFLKSQVRDSFFHFYQHSMMYLSLEEFFSLQYICKSKMHKPDGNFFNEDYKLYLNILLFYA